MKLILFLCTIFIFRKTVNAESFDYDDDSSDEISFRSAFPTDMIANMLEDSDPQTKAAFRTVSNLLNPMSMLPNLSCQGWRCKLSFPGFLNIVPDFVMEVGLIPSQLRYFSSLYVGGRLKHAKTFGVTDFKLCIPFTHICLKLTYVKLPWGPICAEFNDKQLPCFQMNGWFPSLAYPKYPLNIESNGIDELAHTAAPPQFYYEQNDPRSNPNMRF